MELDRANITHRANYIHNRQVVIDFLGGKCFECGSIDRLEIDHIDPKTKLFDVGRKLLRVSISASVWKEIAKCQLLCYTDHHAKSIAEMSVDHGGGVSGKKNCKCDLCRNRKNEYMREWKRARRTHGAVEKFGISPVS